jgi:hypothetical protein
MGQAGAVPHPQPLLPQPAGRPRPGDLKPLLARIEDGAAANGPAFRAANVVTDGYLLTQTPLHGSLMPAGRHESSWNGTSA